MFSHCSSLTSIDLSNFNTNNAINMDGIFGGCKFLKKESIIIKDKTILDDPKLFKEFDVRIKYK